jgi:terminal uridylyltransferase
MRNYLDQNVNNTAAIDISRDGLSSPISQAPFTHIYTHTHSPSTATITSRVQLIPQHLSGSPPHSPLRNSMHGRMGMVCGTLSESSSPTSGSCSPSPSPTLLHQQHAVNDFSRYNTFKMVAPRLRRIQADPATVDLTPDVALR